MDIEQLKLILDTLSLPKFVGFAVIVTCFLIWYMVKKAIDAMKSYRFQNEVRRSAGVTSPAKPEDLLGGGE